jgi:hypothetical protein
LPNILKRAVGRWVLACLVVTVTAGVLAGPRAVQADEPALLMLRGGFAGDIVADRDSGGIFAFEYHSGPEWEFYHLRPTIGLQATTNGSFYVWGGGKIDLFFGKRFVLTPTTGVGFYSDGDGQDLDSVLIFRNGIDFAYRLDSRARVGLGFHYKSNYGLGDDDPGIAALTVFYTHPLGTLLP